MQLLLDKHQELQILETHISRHMPAIIVIQLSNFFKKDNILSIFKQ